MPGRDWKQIKKDGFFLLMSVAVTLSVEEGYQEDRAAPRSLPCWCFPFRSELQRSSRLAYGAGRRTPCSSPRPEEQGGLKEKNISTFQEQNITFVVVVLSPLHWGERRGRGLGLSVPSTVEPPSNTDAATQTPVISLGLLCVLCTHQP